MTPNYNLTFDSETYHQVLTTILIVINNPATPENEREQARKSYDLLMERVHLENRMSKSPRRKFWRK